MVTPMSKVLLVRATVKPDRAADVEAAAEAMFDAIHAAHPGGVRYASLRVPESDVFVALLAVDEDTDNPLTSIPEFQAFQENLRGWLSEPPIAEQLRAVGSYRMF